MPKKKKPPRVECSNCSAYDVELLACGRCRLVQYCSRNCQKQHWTAGGHSKFCVAVEVRKPAPFETEVVIGEVTCLICLESIKGASASKLPCDHVFHADCIKELRCFGVAQLCPACRSDLPDGPEKIDEACRRRFLKLMIKLQAEPFSKEDRDEAEAILAGWTIAGDQGHVAAQFMVGLLHLQGKIVERNVDLAELWFRKAADQNNASALSNLGIILKTRLDPTGAVDCFQRAIKADPNHLHAHFNLGVMLFDVDLTAAVERFRKVIALDPNFAEGFFNLGVAIYMSGFPVAAEAYYRRAIKLDGKHFKAFFNLGLLLTKQGKNEEAKPFLETAVRLNPHDSEARLLLDSVI